MNGRLEVLGRRRSSAEIARVIRGHLKAGKSRAEILEAESLTPKQYRWGLMTLGKFPKKNAEAFATFLADELIRIERISEDMELARHAGDFRAVAAFHKLVNDIKSNTMELALKLGLLQRAAEKLEVSEVSYTVSFGDEASPTKWPAFGGTLTVGDSKTDHA